MNESREAQLRATLNMIPASTWYTTPSGGLIFVNERNADYGGLPSDHPLRFGTDTSPAWDAHIPFIHPDDQEETRRVWSECLRTGRPGEVSFRVRNAEGNYRWFLSRAEPLRSNDGTILNWIGINLDIEERKQAEVELRRSEEERRTAEEKIRVQEAELRQTLDFAPQLVAIFGPHRERLYLNRMSLEYFGFTLEEWFATETRPGDEVHPDDAERLRSQWRLAIATGSAFEIEVRFRKNDGIYRWFLIRCNPLRDEQGRVLRWYAAGTDIEERKRDEERLQQENVALREEIDKTSMFEEIVGSSPALAAVLSQVSKVASSNSTVLIAGETGTGKELVARAIHRRSQRASRGFVAVNCAAIPRDLIASELFGHEKGAFTGALQRRLGRFELADGGTIFLDEVGELASDTQAALLRVLQEREFERVGGQHPIPVDVRVIAATNRDLAEAVAEGSFRRDLFYRLNVFPLEVPPLRDRQEDIAVLVEYFIDRYARKAGKTIRRVSKRTLDRLKSYPWPGNVRELQNVIERSVIVSDTDEFTVDESWLSTQPGVARRLGISDALASHEKALIEDALRATEGRVFGPSGAAARLGIPRSTLESKIRALKINKNRFRAGAQKRS
jgi:PAS domain S-box-containing protein